MCMVQLCCQGRSSPGDGTTCRRGRKNVCYGSKADVHGVRRLSGKAPGLTNAAQLRCNSLTAMSKSRAALEPPAMRLKFKGYCDAITLGVLRVLLEPGKSRRSFQVLLGRVQHDADIAVFRVEACLGGFFFRSAFSSRLSVVRSFMASAVLKSSSSKGAPTFFRQCRGTRRVASLTHQASRAVDDGLQSVSDASSAVGPN